MLPHRSQDAYPLHVLTSLSNQKANFVTWQLTRNGVLFIKCTCQCHKQIETAFPICIHNSDFLTLGPEVKAFGSKASCFMLSHVQCKRYLVVYATSFQHTPGNKIQYDESCMKLVVLVPRFV